jgi:hypothetical protein
MNDTDFLVVVGGVLMTFVCLVPWVIGMAHITTWIWKVFGL